ncbi:MAG: response regulator transcription factor [Micrococcales bacterium]|nr:response regulator transcription factor [Micrococcales bacterium]
MTQEAPVRVVVVDDEAMIRAGLAVILSTFDRIEVVGEAADGQAGVDLVRQVQPDVVLMDVQMPVLDGLAATRAIVADPRCHAAVIVLTTFHREDYLLAALQAGACGFLLKTDGPEHLSTAVLAAAAGDGLLSPEVTREVIARAVSAWSVPATDLTHPSLTEREVEVLRLVARGLSNDEIAAELFISRTTVKTHVSNLLAKLSLRDRVQIVLYAYEHGYAG